MDSLLFVWHPHSYSKKITTPSQETRSIILKVLLLLDKVRLAAFCIQSVKLSYLAVCGSFGLIVKTHEQCPFLTQKSTFPKFVKLFL